MMKSVSQKMRERQAVGDGKVERLPLNESKPVLTMLNKAGTAISVLWVLFVMPVLSWFAMFLGFRSRNSRPERQG